MPEDYYRVLNQNKQIESNLKRKPVSPLKPESLMQPDPEDEETLLSQVELPQETLYLIDKVVRQRAKQGPIGVDNSELIGMEMEQEVKERNMYIEKLSGVLARGGDSEGAEKENNEKLLERLTSAATRIHEINSKMQQLQISKQS